MKLQPLAAALALAAIVPAHAADYSLTFAGTKTHYVNPFECGGGGICPPGTPPVVSSPWSGTLLITAPSEDGSYTVESFSLLAASIDGRALSLYVPLGETFVVTIAGAKVASLDGDTSQGTPPQRFTFDGMSVHWLQRAEHHYGETSGDAQIAGVVTHAPEPETWALLLAGIALVAHRKARIDRWRCGSASFDEGEK